MTGAAPSEPVRVTSVHDLEPGWPWIASLYHGQPAVEWHSVSTRRSRFLARLPGPHWGRIRAALQIRRILARNQADLVVSHGPYTSYYVEALGRREKRDVPHLAFAFNFTDIPDGYRLEAMRRAFAHTDRFTVYSRMERELYAETFGVPIDRFIFSRWAWDRRYRSRVRERFPALTLPQSAARRATTQRCAKRRDAFLESSLR